MLYEKIIKNLNYKKTTFKGGFFYLFTIFEKLT
ncbi:hypothetical protein C8C84_0603 [Flavobacterium sp. 102]|nr:hypothetical protein C8C84_0603 [Flavobacterium sp. 102]